MSKKIIYLWLAFFCSCVVSREKHAASLRELELAKGRLTDQKRGAQKEKDQLNTKLAQLQREKEKADERSKATQEQTAKQYNYDLKLLGTRVEALEMALGAWRSLVYGQLTSNATSSSSSVMLPLYDPRTQQPNFITSAAGASLTLEGSAQVEALAEQLKKNDQLVWLLGFADGTTDDLKASSEYALVVAQALLASGLAASRLRVSFLGAAQPICKDTPVNNKREAQCVNQNNRVQIVLLAEGL